MGCWEYERFSWCDNGEPTAVYFTGEDFNYPEKNCCICGKKGKYQGELKRRNINKNFMGLSKIKNTDKSLDLITFIVACNDSLPAGYGNGCDFICEDWGENSANGPPSCNNDWSEYDCGTISGTIKNDCRKSCHNCGKILF